MICVLGKDKSIGNNVVTWYETTNCIC